MCLLVSIFIQNAWPCELQFMVQTVQTFFLSMGMHVQTTLKFSLLNLQRYHLYLYISDSWVYIGIYGPKKDKQFWVTVGVWHYGDVGTHCAMGASSDDELIELLSCHRPASCPRKGKFLSCWCLANILLFGLFGLTFFPISSYEFA